MHPSLPSARAFASLLTVGFFAAGAVSAQPALPADALNLLAPLGVVNLAASATDEVVRDWLGITLATGRDAPTAAAVQSQLKQALDAALIEAKKAARPGEVDVRTGTFNVSPRYTDKGVPDGWHGSAELVVEGRDMQAIGQLTGRIATLTIARVGYDISRELRERTEGQVTARAIALFQQRAAECARQFGYASYAIREVTVNAVDAGPGRPMAMAMRFAKAVDEALPVEPGKGTVTVNVGGSVQMTR